MGDRRLVVAHGGDRRRMAAEALETLDAASFLPAGAAIGLKPNLVVAKPSSSGATTDPELAAGVLSYLADHGWREFIILEGSWLGADTSEAFRVCGYDRLAAEFGARLVDLKSDPAERVEAGGLAFEVCRSARAVDVLIDLPVLKAHCQTGLTCALKNLKGCVPDREKRRFHALGLHRPIACLAKALPVSLVVVDAVCGDLVFEEGGHPAPMDRVLAGRDPVMVDAYAAELIGFAPREIEYLGLAAALGVGEADWRRAELMELGRASHAAAPGGGAPRRGARASNVDAREACSACYGPLLGALARLGGNGPRATIKVGQGFRGLTGRGPGIGDCTSGLHPHLAGCPPTGRAMAEFLRTQARW